MKKGTRLPIDSFGVPATESGQTLRQRAEEAFRAKASQMPKRKETQSPEETRQTLHELRVHQIELELQNEELRRTQAELEAARVRYFDLYDLAPVGYCTISEPGLILEANLTAVNLLGVARGDLVKQPLSRFILKEYQEIYYRHRKQLFETGESPAYELQMVKKDRTTFWALIEAIVAQDAEGTPVCRFVMSDITERKRTEGALQQAHDRLEHRVAERTEELRQANEELRTDITDRKRAEDALKESEAKNRALFEDGPIESMVVDREGRIIQLNKAFERSVEKGGRRLPEIGNRMYLDYASSHSTDLRTELMDSIHSKTAKTFNEMPYKGRFLNISMAPTKEGAIISTIDVTERKHAEEALRASEARYRSYIDVTGQIAWLTNADGGIVEDVPSFRKFTGQTYEEAKGSGWAKAVHPEDLERTLQVWNEAVAAKAPYETEYRMRRHDGVYRHLLARGFPVFTEDGNIWEWVGTLIDITERKRTEEEKRSLQERLNRAEKMEALGLLAGGVAHDLNNVLGIVVGYAEMLLMAADKSSSIRPQLVSIMKGGQRAAAIVDDLLTLARRGVSDREVLNLNKIIADCQKSPEFEKLSSYHSSVKIKTDIDPDLLNISGSSVHLGKTLFNLVSNASEAMTKGGLVTIKTTNQYLDKPIQGYDHIQEGDYVVLSVSDTGEGIHTTDLKRIFEPFYTKKVMGRSGTGLGLAVVWGTVKDHHGYINVESEEGKGSTFTLYFPVTREDITAEAVAIAISEYMGNGESILVVDDVKEQRDLAAGMLGTLNYNVWSVSSGEEAVVYLKEHKIDLMVLDMIMDPGMDGLDTYRIILEIHPKQKAIIVSGFSESDRVKAAKGLGAGAYVRKPYVIEKLGLAVRNELERVA